MVKLKIKEWLKALVKRAGDLILKLVSLKVVVATILTVVALSNEAFAGPTTFLVLALVWIAVLSLREIAKMKGIRETILAPFQRGTE